MQAPISRALGFLLAAAALGAVGGRLVRAFWNARIARLPLEYPWNALYGIVPLGALALEVVLVGAALALRSRRPR